MITPATLLLVVLTVIGLTVASLALRRRRVRSNLDVLLGVSAERQLRSQVDAENTQLHKDVDGLRAELGRLKKEIVRREVVAKTKLAVKAQIPEQTTVVVVSRGDDELINLSMRRAWHFPQTEDGNYAGHHPGSSAEAIAQLEALRARGAHYFLIPSTSAWWLDYYEQLRRHLESNYSIVFSATDACVIFDLGQEITVTARANERLAA